MPLSEVFSFIANYGYLAVFVGSLFEGESILLLAGLLAHNDHLSLQFIIMYAFAGAIIGDFGWFLLGRYKGKALLEKYDWLKRWTAKPTALIDRKPASISFSMRFMYGFRHIVPFSIGLSSIPARTFFLWNFLGAVLWVFVFSGLGYLLGDILESTIGSLKRYEIMLIVVAVLGVVGLNTLGRALRRLLKRVVVEDKAEEE